MVRTADKERIRALLSQTEGLSNLRIKTELNLSDDRYSDVRDDLINDGLVEKYVCRGGGIRLTREGEKESLGEDFPKSSVKNESELYAHLTQFLEQQAAEDETEAVVIPTHSLKARGQWQNPDVTRLTLEHYRNLRKLRVVVTTFEVKQFPRWNVSAVYEAASHHRFSHESHVVLEWPNGAEFSITDPTYKLDQLVRECQRYGVGLATLQPYYNSYRLRPRLDATPTTPDDEDVEAWLDYAFSRNQAALKDYDTKMHSVQARLAATQGKEVRSE